MVEIIDMEKYC